MKKSIKNHLYDVFIRDSDEVIICLDNNFAIIEFNTEAEQIYGWDKEDVLSLNFIELCQKDSISLPIENFNRVINQKRHKAVINAISPKNGIESIVKWNISPVTTEDGTYIIMQGIDITRHKLTEGNEKKLSIYLENIINNLPHFIFWKDKNSVFLGCNKKFSTSLGFSNPEDVVGKTDFDMPWTSDQSQSYIDDDLLIMNTGKAKINFEEKQRQPDGSEITVLVSKVPMYNQHNEVTGILGIYTDITERKKEEEKLRRAMQEAETANQLKSEFIYNMEHDIRTPFNGILGMATILQLHETDLEKKTYLNEIALCTQQLLDYCMQIVDFSKIESGALPVLIKKFCLKSLIEEVETIEKPAVRSKNLELNIKIDPAIPNYIIGDSYRLKRILINLISNSIKFTETGYINLSVQLSRIIKQRNIILTFIVEDTGMGIPQDKQNLIYQKFVRIFPSHKGTYDGKGLGLRIVKQFIEELDGDIEVKSEINAGTTFTCSIPFKLPLVEEVSENTGTGT